MTQVKWHKTFLGVGSNMGDRQGHIDRALELLRSREDCKNVEISKIIETKPYGDVPQDDYLNCCFKMETTLEPEELLMVLHEIEAAEGRVRKVHWGPRTLDLDILLYEDLVYTSEDLIIPHADMKNRFFVLEPLSDIGKEEVHPVLNKTIGELYESLLMERFLNTEKQKAIYK